MVPTAARVDVIGDSWERPLVGTAFIVTTVCAAVAALSSSSVDDVSWAWVAVTAAGAVLALVPVLTAIADDRIDSLFQEETPMSLVGVGYGLMFVAWGARRRSVVRAVPAGAIVGLAVAVAMSEAVWRTTFNDQGMIERTRASTILDDLWPVLGCQSAAASVVGCAWLVCVRRSVGRRGPARVNSRHTSGEISRGG